MYRWINHGLLSLVMVALGGCDVLFPGSGETGSAELMRFASQQELSEYIRDQIQARNSVLPDLDRASGDLGAPGSEPTSGGVADGDSAARGDQPQGPGDEEGFSGTTTQEQGVDEADVLKTDGTYFYMLDSRFDGTTVLRMVRAVPLDALQVISETPLEGHGQDLYLRGDVVVAITSSGGYFFGVGGGGGVIAEDVVSVDAPDAEGSGEGSTPSGEGDGQDEPEPDSDIAAPADRLEYHRPFTIVHIIDVSDPTAPSVASTTKFDGTPASSRMIEGYLHLVLANYQGYYYDVLPMLGRPELQVAEADIAELLPDYEKTTADGATDRGDLVTWENLYRPTDPDGFGMVTVVSMDTDDPQAAFASVGIVAEPGLIYSSLEALYLTDTSYPFEGNKRTTTDIYKFAYDAASATPVATGSVPGRILNQYSMGEHQGHLRVATTIDAEFSFARATEPVNAIYVLEQAGEALSILGSAENIAVGETIQSARFTGSRCYLVTFRQIDPLFTIDLSEPADPHVVGELKVPGFSTYLTPMGADHVLSVGQYVPPPGEFGAWGVQLSIFDVSDFANPQRSANVVIGGDSGGSYSEALWNPKAFTYFPEREVVALPVSIYGNIFVEDRPGGFGEEPMFDEDTGTSTGGQADAPPPTEPTEAPVDGGFEIPEHFEGLLVFSATPQEGLTELGRISTQFGDAGFYYPSFTRGVFIGQHVYAVTNFGLRAAPLGDVSDVQGELFYGSEPGVDEPTEPQPEDEPGVPEQ